MKNIYLVQASDNHGPNKFLPLAIGYQWCYGKNDDWTLKDVLIEKIEPKDYVATMQQPELVAMSSYVWNWEYNRELAKQIKRKFRQCKIITGGPQINKYDPDFFDKHPMFDAFIHGEGEEAFKTRLTKAFEDLKDYENCLKVSKGVDFIYNMACNMGGMGFIENNKAECMLSVLINTNLLRASLFNSVEKYFFLLAHVFIMALSKKILSLVD